MKRAIGYAGLFLLVCWLVLQATGCKPGVAPRETARSVVLLTADAVKQLDVACARMATAKHDALLATRCADGYDVARAALIGAELAVDAYDSAGAGDLPCAVARATEAVQRIALALSAAGGTVPPVVADALRIAPALTVACRG